MVGPLIDKIYEAAFLPEKWEIVLNRLAEIAEAERSLALCGHSRRPKMDSIRRY